MHTQTKCQINERTNNSIFRSVDIKVISTEQSYYPASDPYRLNSFSDKFSYEIVYMSDKSIKNVDELEFQIANDYFMKKFGMGISELKLDKLKELYPEIFLIA